MQRREVLKRGTVGIGVGIGLAGCSGDGDDGSGDGTTDGNDGGTEFEQESAGEVRSNAIDELTVVGWRSEVANETFSVHVTVENGGEQQADASEYTYQIIPYDESGSELETNGFTKSFPNETSMGSGSTGSVKVSPSMSADAETVASYEIVLDCSGMFAEGVYCPE